MRQHPGRWSLIVASALSGALQMAGCARHSEPTPSTSAPPGEPSTAAAAQNGTGLAAETPLPEGSAQIATEPDGVHIEYRTYGSGDPAVVLIHGWATDANYWNAQLNPLKSKYTVVTVDLAGHGASTKNRTDWSMSKYGEDVATVVRRIRNPQVVLVGHSMGGTVALEAATQLPERVIGIIVVDALKSIGQPPMPAAEIERRVAPFRADFIGAVRKYAADSLFRPDADPAFVQKVAYDMSLEPPEVGVPSLQALLGMDLATVLPGIHVPVLAINSDLTPTDEARIRKSLPTFKAEILAHSGHFLMMEAPDRFNPILLRDIDTIAHRAGQR